MANYRDGTPIQIGDLAIRVDASNPPMMIGSIGTVAAVDSCEQVRFKEYLGHLWSPGYYELHYRKPPLDTSSLDCTGIFEPAKVEAVDPVVTPGMVAAAEKWEAANLPKPEPRALAFLIARHVGPELAELRNERDEALKRAESLDKRLTAFLNLAFSTDFSDLKEFLPSPISSRVDSIGGDCE